MANWHSGPNGNYVLDADELEHFCSYIPPNGGFWGGTALGSQKGETALWLNGQYLILEGDWRTEYLAAWPDPIALYEVYDKNKSARSDWSEDEGE